VSRWGPRFVCATESTPTGPTRTRYSRQGTGARQFRSQHGSPGPLYPEQADQEFERLEKAGAPVEEIEKLAQVVEGGCGRRGRRFRFRNGRAVGGSGGQVAAGAEIIGELFDGTQDMIERLRVLQTNDAFGVYR
jgi:hypothetical protein